MYITPPHPMHAGQTIGLFGGSFDPVHDGHFLVATRAMHILNLDHIWWMLTPQNPLKQSAELNFNQRLAILNQTLTAPKMHAVTIEQDIGSTYTIKTIRFLKQRFPQCRFVLVIGFDSTQNFHKWRHWQDILAEVPVLVINRAPERLGDKMPKIRRYKKVRHITLRKRTALALYNANLILWDGHGPTSPLSSTFIRQRKKLDAPHQSDM